MSAERKPARMTEEQRDTVEKNLGLVGAQVKRLLERGGRYARAGEQWDDLFQEGCAGLIQAVQTYDPGSGMTLATYAVPRIHYAVWRALCRDGEPIRLPERYGRRKAEKQDETEAIRGHSPYRKRIAGRQGRSRAVSKNPNLPHVRWCTPEELSTIPAKSDPWEASRSPSEAVSGDEPATIGDMLRRKLEAAVNAAVERLGVSGPARRNRGLLARTLADQRLLVPEPSFQASLREIARATRSSYGRVAACEAVLMAEVRRCLSGDVEFTLCSEAGRRRQNGMAAEIDPGLRSALRERVIDSIAGTFSRLPRAERADLLLNVLEQTGVDTTALLRTHAADLTAEARSDLLARMSRADAAPVG